MDAGEENGDGEEKNGLLDVGMRKKRRSTIWQGETMKARESEWRQRGEKGVYNSRLRIMN